MLITVFLKLSIATILGMALGLERELKRKPLGLKTSTVICVASCLVTIVSIQSAYQFDKPSHITMDPLRLAAQIISGVGFLGAGVIMVKGLTVTVLTTAALIWSASGIGVAVGAGFWKEAAIALILMIVCVEIVPSLIKIVGPGRLREKELQMSIVVEESINVEELQKLIKQKNVVIHQVRVKDLSTGERKLEYILSTYEKRYTTNVYQEVRSINGVTSVEISTVG